MQELTATATALNFIENDPAESIVDPDHHTAEQLSTLGPQCRVGDYVEVIPPLRDDSPLIFGLAMDKGKPFAQCILNLEHLQKSVHLEWNPAREIARAEDRVKEAGDSAIGEVGSILGEWGGRLNKHIRHSIEMMPNEGQPVLTKRFVLDNIMLNDLVEGTGYPPDEMRCLIAYSVERFGVAAFLRGKEREMVPPYFQAVDNISRQCAEPLTDKNRHWMGIYTGDVARCNQLILDVLSRYDLPTICIGPHIPQTLDIPFLKTFPGSPVLLVEAKRRFSPFVTASLFTALGDPMMETLRDHAWMS